jgi:hypothetical protein
MDKRILKRHKRQVSRARERGRVSEPDVRTPEELTAAREVSRSIASRHSLPHAHYSSPSIRNSPGPSAEDARKAEKE